MPPQLMGKLLSNAMRPYKAIPKGLDKLLGDNNYDKLVTGNALDLNQQSAITLINASGPVFFGTLINLTQTVDSSISIPIRVFLHQQCKVMVIKRTIDTPELGKLTPMNLPKQWDGYSVDFSLTNAKSRKNSDNIIALHLHDKLTYEMISFVTMALRSSTIQPKPLIYPG